MILDSKLNIADETVLPTAVGTAVVGDVIDLDKSGRRIGDGHPLYLAIIVDEAVASSGAATVEFSLSTGSSSTLGTTVSSTGEISKDTLSSNHQMVIPLPSDYQYERYLGLEATVATSALTAGSVNAFIIPTPPANWYAVEEGQN